jgi:hypothetical protein
MTNEGLRERLNKATCKFCAAGSPIHKANAIVGSDYHEKENNWCTSLADELLPLVESSRHEAAAEMREAVCVAICEYCRLGRELIHDPLNAIPWGHYWVNPEISAKSESCSAPCKAAAIRSLGPTEVQAARERIEQWIASGGGVVVTKQLICPRCKEGTTFVISLKDKPGLWITCGACEWMLNSAIEALHTPTNPGPAQTPVQSDVKPKICTENEPYWD